jgi:hypothetical protein
VCDACVFWIVTMSLVFFELVFAVDRLCVSAVFSVVAGCVMVGTI